MKRGNRSPPRQRSILTIMVFSAAIILSSLVVWSDLQKASSVSVQPATSLQLYDSQDNQTQVQSQPLVSNPIDGQPPGNVSRSESGMDQLVSESKLLPIWEVPNLPRGVDLIEPQVEGSSAQGVGSSASQQFQQIRRRLPGRPYYRPRRPLWKKEQREEWRRNMKKAKSQYLDKAKLPYRKLQRQINKLKSYQKWKKALQAENEPTATLDKKQAKPRARPTPPPKDTLTNEVDDSFEGVPDNGRGFNTEVLAKVTAFLNSSENKTTTPQPPRGFRPGYPKVHPDLFDHSPWRPFSQVEALPQPQALAQRQIQPEVKEARQLEDLPETVRHESPTRRAAASRPPGRRYRNYMRTVKHPYKALVQVYQSTDRGYPGPVESTTKYNFDVYPTHKQLNDDDYFFDDFVTEFSDEFPSDGPKTTSTSPRPLVKDSGIQNREEERILIPDDNVKDIYEDYFYTDDPDYVSQPPPPPPPRPTPYPKRPEPAYQQTVRHPPQHAQHAHHGQHYPPPAAPRRRPILNYQDYEQYQPNIPMTPIPKYKFPSSEFSKYFPTRQRKPKRTRVLKKQPLQRRVPYMVKHQRTRPRQRPKPRPRPPHPPPQPPQVFNSPGPYYDVNQVPVESPPPDDDEEEYPYGQQPSQQEYQQLQKAYLNLLKKDEGPPSETEEAPREEEDAPPEYDQDEYTQRGPEPSPDYYDAEEKKPRQAPAEYEDAPSTPTNRGQPVVEYEDMAQYDDAIPEEMYEHGVQGADENYRGIRDPREYVQRNTAKTFDAGWDEFFNGHRDNIDDDIGTLSHSSENYAAPEGGSQEQQQNQPQGEEGQGEPVRDEEQRDPRERERGHGGEEEERGGPQHDNYRRQKGGSDDYEEPPDYENPSGAEEYQQRSPSSDYEAEGESTQPPTEDHPQDRRRDQGDYDRFKHLEEQERIAEKTHESDYEDDEDDYVQSEEGGPRVNKPQAPMQYSHGELPLDTFPEENAAASADGSNVPGFDDFFSRIEDNIEGEIYEKKDGKRRKWKVPSYRDERPDKPPDGVVNVAEDLRPNKYRDVAPDEFDFRMPSHEELQENYKTETSSSDVDVVAVPWSPQKVKTAPK